MTWLVEILRIYLELVLHHKGFNIAKNPKYDRYQKRLASMVYNFLIKDLLIVVLNVKLCWTNNYQKNYTNKLLENLKNEKYTHLLKTIFWGADLTYSQLLSKFNKVFRFLLCIIDIIVNIRGLLLSRIKRYYNY